MFILLPWKYSLWNDLEGQVCIGSLTLCVPPGTWWCRGSWSPVSAPGHLLFLPPTSLHWEMPRCGHGPPENSCSLGTSESWVVHHSPVSPQQDRPGMGLHRPWKQTRGCVDSKFWNPVILSMVLGEGSRHIPKTPCFPGLLPKTELCGVLIQAPSSEMCFTVMLAQGLPMGMADISWAACFSLLAGPPPSPASFTPQTCIGVQTRSPHPGLAPLHPSQVFSPDVLLISCHLGVHFLEDLS